MGKTKKNYEKITPVNSCFPAVIPVPVMEQFKKQIQKIIDSIPNRPHQSRGEPLKYNKNFCFKILNEFAQGKDKIAICIELGITYQIFCRWRKSYPEFEYAVSIGEQLGLRFWTEVGRLNLFNDQFNHVLWMMNMSNKFKWFSNRNKEEKKIKRVDKKILEINIEDERLARIVNLAENNKTIVDAGRFIKEE
jgi:hypothetical protein